MFNPTLTRLRLQAWFPTQAPRPTPQSITETEPLANNSTESSTAKALHGDDPAPTFNFEDPPATDPFVREVHRRIKALPRELRNEI